MRYFCAAMFALAFGLGVAYHHLPAANAADDPAEKLKEQKAKFNEEFDELIKRFEKAATAADKQGIKAEAKELAVLTADKLLKTAEIDPKSGAAFDAASFAIGRLTGLGASGAAIDKLFAIVTEHHLDNAKVKDLVLVAGRAGATGEKFLETASAKSKDQDVRAISLYILGMSASSSSDDAVTEKASTELVNKAVALLERAKKESPKVKVDGEAMEKACDAEIKSVKLLALGQPLPIVKGTELRDQKKDSIDKYKGKVVLVDIWATWCGPCVGMIPHENALVKRMAGKPFQLLSVSVDEKKDTLTKFIDKTPMPWTHWWDDGEENPLIQTLKVKAYPTLYLVDATGKIRRKWIGVPEPIETLDKAIDELVKEASSAKN